MQKILHFGCSKILFALSLIHFLSLSPAQAHLGGDESSVEKDRAEFGAEKTLRKSLSYNVYELVSERHTVREFVDQNGQIFAITWAGQLPPKLATLLGEHHTDFMIQRIATPSVRGQRNFQTIKTDKIQVVQSGHMGHWTGSAVLIGKTPPGLRLDQLE